MSTIFRTHSVRYPAFERAYDCRVEGREAFQKRTTPQAPDAPEIPMSSTQIREANIARTKGRFAEAVRKHDGSTLGDTIRRTSHHYNCDETARRFISYWLETGQIDGVFTTVDGGQVRVWAVEI